MERINQDEIAKWRVEIENAESFRDEEFGKSKYRDKTKSGQNIDYFETGMSTQYLDNSALDEYTYASINVIYPIVKNVIPNLYYKNPYILSFPKRKSPEDELSAPFAGALLNHFHKELDMKNINKQVVFDAFVLGMGVCKMGYTTKFGTMPTEETVDQEKKDREKAKSRSILEKLGLKKPKEEDKPKANPELNEFIRSESPFSIWVNPFEFIIDPTATSIENANWVAQKITKRLSDVKKDETYKNTVDLEGTPKDDMNLKDIPQTQIDNFKFIDLYEVHYKTDEGINILTIAKDGKRTEALRHDKSVYQMDGFQYEVLYFNKHNHKLYPKSDIDVIKGLQDRINITLESILDQVDKYVPKLFVNETALTDQGKKALIDGDVGAVVYTNTNPGEAVSEGRFTQVKADLIALIDKSLEIIMLETGLTKAQLMGLTDAQTATEAQIGQAGQSLRMSDKFDAVGDFLNRQTRKFWQVVKQFVDLEEISLITGEQDVDPTTGMASYSWMPDIDSVMADKLAKGEYRFEIEMGSTEKPDLPILRKQVENFVNILGGPGVLETIAQQGYKIELVEILREYLNLFPNMFQNPGRIIKPIQDPAQSGVMPQQPPGGPGGPGGGGQGMNQQALNSPPPNVADIISEIGGEKGQGPPIA